MTINYNNDTCCEGKEIYTEPATLAQQMQELTRKLLVLQDIVYKMDRDLFFNNEPCGKLDEPKCLAEELTMQNCLVDDIGNQLRMIAERICK